MVWTSDMSIFSSMSLYSSRLMSGQIMGTPNGS